MGAEREAVVGCKYLRQTGNCVWALPFYDTISHPSITQLEDTRMYETTVRRTIYTLSSRNEVQYEYNHESATRTA